MKKNSKMPKLAATVQKGAKIEAMAETLWKDPSVENWEKFALVLRNSKAKYYKVFYESLRNSEDLTKSFARIYDSKMKPVAKVPIIIKKGKKVEGATIFLKGLNNANIF
ncbi:MAG: hypothetical protein ACP5MX_00505 [Candidatus Micrarchaeia archaeon]